MVLPDRRKHPRVRLESQVKLRNGVSGRYVAGQTLDISAGGAMLRVTTPTRLVRGQSVSLGISSHPRQPIIAAQDMISAVVVRSLGIAGTQHVAVEFDQPHRMAAAG